MRSLNNFFEDFVYIVFLIVSALLFLNGSITIFNYFNRLYVNIKHRYAFLKNLINSTLCELRKFNKNIRYIYSLSQKPQLSFLGNFFENIQMLLPVIMPIVIPIITDLILKKQTSNTNVPKQFDKELPNNHNEFKTFQNIIETLSAQLQKIPMNGVKQLLNKPSLLEELLFEKNSIKSECSIKSEDSIEFEENSIESEEYDVMYPNMTLEQLNSFSKEFEDFSQTKN